MQTITGSFTITQRANEHDQIRYLVEVELDDHTCSCEEGGHDIGEAFKEALLTSLLDKELVGNDQ